MKIFDDIELFVVISLTLLAKWLMTEEPTQENESPEMKRNRRKRAYGGVIAGALMGYYGPNLLISWSANPDSIVSGIFNSDLIISITIIMALSGEHIFRALISKLPAWIDLVVKKRIDS